MSRGNLVLAAEDPEDLEVISAHLQDAVTRIKDIAYLPKKRRFAAVFNRFKWEKPERGREGGNVRVQSGVHFDNVLSVKSKNMKLGAHNAVVSLLAIRHVPNSSDVTAGAIELYFSGGGVIRLEVECIEVELSDLSNEWAARGRPAHEAG